jgi:glucan phosphoethanolaminetransferase (alkaline phosphatase superfamily)
MALGGSVGAKYRQRLLPLLGMALVAVPLVSAKNFLSGFGSGNSPLQPILELVASMFNINLSPALQIGLMRFFLFLLLFAVLNWSARTKVFRENDVLSKKTANIVALIIALIIAIFMPQGLVAGFLGILVGLGLPALLMGWSFWLIKEKKEGS